MLLIPAALLTAPTAAGAATFVGLWLTRTYWWTPARIKRRQVLPHAPTPLTPLASVEALPLAMQMPVNRHRFALEALGFRAAAPLHDARVRVPPVVLSLEHAEHQTVASLLVPPARGDREPMWALCFISRTATGERIVTSNMLLPSIFPSRPDDRQARFPGEREPRRLYALHRARVREAGPQAPLALGDPVAFHRDEELASFAWWCACGFVRPRAGGLHYTWKGAYLGAWKLQAPWRAHVEATDEALRVRLAREAGLDD